MSRKEKDHTNRTLCTAYGFEYITCKCDARTHTIFISDVALHIRNPSENNSFFFFFFSFTCFCFRSDCFRIYLHAAMAPMAATAFLYNFTDNNVEIIVDETWMDFFPGIFQRSYRHLCEIVLRSDVISIIYYYFFRSLHRLLFVWNARVNAVQRTTLIMYCKYSILRFYFWRFYMLVGNGMVWYDMPMPMPCHDMASFHMYIYCIFWMDIVL